MDFHVGSAPFTVGEVTWYKTLDLVPEALRAQALRDTQAMREAAEREPCSLEG